MGPSTPEIPCRTNNFAPLPALEEIIKEKEPQAGLFPGDGRTSHTLFKTKSAFPWPPWPIPRLEVPTHRTVR